MTCARTVVFSGYSIFLYQWNWPQRYNWNIVESGVKHNKPNPYPLSAQIPCLLYFYGKHFSYCIISCRYRDSINTMIIFHVLIHPYYFLNKQNLQIKLLYIQMFQYITSILYIMYTIIFVYSFNIQNKTNSRQTYIYIAWVA